jgi:hypothetical protein
MWENVFYMADNYVNMRDHFSLLKIRLLDDKVPTHPPFVKIAREVTHEKGYTSKVLAKKNWYAPDGDEDILKFRKDSM